MKTLLTNCALLLAAGLILALGEGAASAQNPPPGGGLKLYVQKKVYASGETVKFKLHKYAGVDDTPADLRGSYYLIEKNTGHGWREFYTSRRNPLGTTLPLETDRVWTWNQKDNEGTHRALPGQWRLRFFAPNGNISGPLEVRFQIK